MKNIILALALFSLAASAPAVDIDGIAATVGSESILKSEVAGEMRRSEGSGESYETVLNRLIDRKLILKAAAASKMTMQEWVVDNRIREITDRALGGDRNRLLAELAREKLPYTEFRKRIKDDLIVGAMRWNVVDKNVTASPAAMRAEYEANREKYAAVARASVRVILLRPTELELREIVDAELATNDFAAVAKRFSADPHAADGGLWKNVDPGESFQPAVVEALAKTPVGRLTPWIDLGGWSCLVRKEDETASGERTFAEAYEDVADAVKEKRAAELYREWTDRLKAATFVKIY